MYDVSSRRIVVDRIHQDRLAEAHRAHVLREAREGIAPHQERQRVSAGPSFVERVIARVRGAAPVDRTQGARTGRPAPAA